ncbi:acetyltransferase [Pseudovibrio japonicus]|uniref:Acetyltransferase n=1 Tax=Pseudovibrio japonicus TaxID=366534 RepID=A0ABQ3EEW2_9HYPH|nr:GNAT family N-acetyltransferase [Pseudovibrio japonicus]GHB36282.1 acetyltransferase [Pseudovibrio japonicus]
MSIRKYQADDLDSCLEIFEGNAPKFFDPSERDDFRRYLETLNDPYFVFEQDGKVVGAGGYCQGPKEMGLAWGMVRCDLHGQGIGSALVRYRLERIAQDHPDQAVAIDTSQHTCAFYEKMGFETLSIKEDGYGPGLHMVLMRRPPSLA